MKDSVDEILATINGVLETASRTPITIGDIVVTDNLITDTVLHPAPLANEIWDTYFPMYTGTDVWHFTSPKGAQGILNDGSLRFYNLHHRFGEGEFIDFTKDHNLDGYLKREADDGTKLFVNLMSLNFFLSTSAFDITLESECSNWKVFGSSGTGVRLHIKFDRPRSRFKRVHYSTADHCLPLLRDLIHEVSQNHERPLILCDTNRIGCYYIRGGYSQEDEVRLLLPKQSDGWPRNLIPTTDFAKKVDGVNILAPVEFISVPLNKPTYFDHFPAFTLSLAAVQPGPKADRAQVEKWVNSGPLKGTPVLAKYDETAYDDYCHGLALLYAR